MEEDVYDSWYFTNKILSYLLNDAIYGGGAWWKFVKGIFS
jgi:hypothetical protein